MDDKRIAMPLSMRKLALWNTRNFKPLLTHKQLEPIMSILGFTALPPASLSFNSGPTWKEYMFAAGAQSRLRPRLPYPRIDGLHNHTYQAFLDAVNFHLRMHDISTILHVRGLPLHRADLYSKWHALEEDEPVYVYREGTLDQATQKLCSDSESKDGRDWTYDRASLAVRNKGGEPNFGRVVPLEDIIVSPGRGDDGSGPF